jgi:hypothetical protein
LKGIETSFIIFEILPLLDVTFWNFLKIPSVFKGLNVHEIGW